MDKVIVPSIIAETQEQLDKILDILEPHKGLVQLDVMDGHFVENHSLDFDFALETDRIRCEAQLMVRNPQIWLEGHNDKVETVIVHYETLSNPEHTLHYIQSLGKRPGLAINPETSPEIIRPYLDIVSRVLVMTVHPGSYGAEFLPDMLDKVKTLRSWRPDLDLEVDGGIDSKTIKKADQAGANLFVSGSYLVQPGQFRQRLKTLKKLIGIHDE
jgi:ribulose-phosphate 3-epimerase